MTEQNKTILKQNVKALKILISGASKGIGLFLFQKLKDDGHLVLGTYTSTKPPSEFVDFFTKVDVSDDKQVADWVAKSVNEEDNIVLINCASINYNVLARKAEVEKWKHLIDVNLVGTFRTINSILPQMYEKGFGRIINFSSIVAQKGIPGTSAYAASKAALWGMAKSIAVENAKRNITINNINLGYFNIGMTLNDVPENIREDIKEQIPSHELGSPENIYETVKYLIAADYINGTSIDLNGGLF